MGWGRWLLLGDLGQQLDIEDQRKEADRLRRHIASTNSEKRSGDRRLKQLESDVAELKLYIGAMLRLFTAKGLLTADDAKALVISVDDEQAAQEAAIPPRPPPKRLITRRRKP